MGFLKGKGREMNNFGLKKKNGIGKEFEVAKMGATIGEGVLMGERHGEKDDQEKRRCRQGRMMAGGKVNKQDERNKNDGRQKVWVWAGERSEGS